MIRFERHRSPGLQIAILTSLAAVFLIDLLTPLGVAEWVFYLVPVTLSLYVWQPRTPILVAVVCTLLIIVGMVASSTPQSGLSSWIPRINRTMALAAIWMVAIVAREFIHSKLRLREQDWIRAGQNALSARMQGEQKPAQLGDGILRFLCEYLDVPAGALYAATDTAAGLQRRATYAADGTVSARDTVQPGEGLVGQVLKDRRLMRLDHLPPDYLPITSALGKTTPRHLIVVPAIIDDAVQGVIELGFLHPVGRSDIDLLEAVAEPVAAALRSAQYRARQAELLAETQSQAEELQTQQEELRVTNEELEEQSRALRESQARLEAQQAELEQTNAHLEEQAHTLARQRDELSRAQVDLMEKADDLSRANQYKSEFLANMSHELRTPLNSALILAKLLADNRDGNLTAEQVKYAATIYSSGNDLLVLINDILDLSRIEAGRMDLHLEQVDVQHTVESLKRTLQPLAEQKGLAFTVEVEAGVAPTFMSDALRVQQILRNLLSNAFKFTEAGSVALRVAPTEGDAIAFAVADTGIGIAQDRQQVIFEAFRQADGTTNRRYGGTGLGLTISRELARRLGGDIGLTSTPGKGSVFTLTLPRLHATPLSELPRPASPEHPIFGLADAAGAAKAVPERGSAGAEATLAMMAQHGTPGDTTSAPRLELPPVARMTLPAIDDDRGSLQPGARSILVIEDDPAFARILRDLAREQRFRALVATSAAEGIRLAERFIPSAVLLDVHLPDDSGLAVLAHLKRSASTRHIPVHVVSVVDCTQQALEMGAIGYALKPVRHEQLIDAIQKIEQRLSQKLRRVLVVEDVSAQRESLVQLLRAENVTIVPVATGAEALQRLRESTFDCMVLDLTLPDMSGYDVLDKMAAGEAFSFPPVIVYTGRVLAQEEEERLHRYASSIIIKGAKSPERLLDEVMLFLHEVEGNLPVEQQRILRELRNREAVLEGRTVLVVDDDARNVFALASVLEAKGARVRLARNGKEALAALEATRPANGSAADLVLMDVMMPEMDGLTAMREIRKHPEWKRLPIIALTAKAMPKDRDECVGAGADDYIAKPLDIDKLLSLIRVWMPK